MIDFVYITPKILAAVFTLLVLEHSQIKDVSLQVGSFSLLYFLISKFGLGYDLNWKELTAATTVFACLIRSKMKLYIKMLIMLTTLAALRPFCYIS